MNIEQSIQSLADSKKAKLLQGFFKTGKGEYGEGDIFLGLVVPQQRKIAKEFSNIPLKEIKSLLKSEFHEYRLIALFILVIQYKRADKDKNEKLKEQIYNFYLSNTNRINNWDLVDLSAPNIVGDFLKNRDKSILYKLVKSGNLWERRIAILATFSFIRDNQFSDSLKISEILLKDKHDLIHKAVGWMLREIGKKDVKVLETFLKRYYKTMPRTMLRYSIEKFPEEKRKAYLKGKIRGGDFGAFKGIGYYNREEDRAKDRL